MKILTNITRILVGCLFMFSGIIKSNDPKGTGIKLNEYFDVFASAVQVKQDSVLIKVTGGVNGKIDSVWKNINTSDSIKTIECNTSYITVDKEDSTAPKLATFYVVYDNEVVSTIKLEKLTQIESEEWITDSISGTPAYVKVATGSDSVLFSYKTGESKKKEISYNLPLYKFAKKESIWVAFFRGMRPYSVLLAIIMCVLEVALGFAILIGWKPKLTIWLTIILIVFFTFLTFYSAYFNKVTDCGCFGDFIKLTPWTSFGKDVVLLILILFLYFRRNHIVPFFSKLFSWNAVTVVTLGSIAFAVYCNSYLPIWDFLPYKTGFNVRELMVPPAGQRANDSVQMVFIYEKNGVKQNFMINALPKSEDGWKYVDRKDSIIIKGYKHKYSDFGFAKRDENDIDIKDSLLNAKKYQILIISGALEKSNEDAWAEIKTLATDAKSKGISVYAATSSSIDEADAFVVQNQLPFKFNNADNTLLKTMARSNPLVMFWYDGKILGKWSCRSVPELKKLEKLMK